MIRPLQIDFLFPVLAKQNLACGRAVNSIIPMLTTTLARNLTQLQMLCTCLYMVGNTCLISTSWSALASNKQLIHITIDL